MNVTSMDLILFKDETLKTLREMEKQIYDKIILKYSETETRIDDFNSKLTKFQEMNKRMYDSVLNQQANFDSIKNLNDFKSKTESKLVSLDVKINKFVSELTTIKSKYDKMIIDNLTVPGLIGASCKFGSISEYINDNTKSIDQLRKEKELLKKQIYGLQSKNDVFGRDLGASINKCISDCKLYTDKKINEIRNYLKEKFDLVNDNINDTKKELKEGILKKNEELNSEIRVEIKNTKVEITNIIEDKNQQSQKIYSDNLNNQKQDFKKQIIEIKNNFKELQLNMEKRIVEAYKLGKNKLNGININNNLLLETNNSLNDTNRNPFDETENINFNDDNNNNYLNNDLFVNNYNNIMSDFNSRNSFFKENNSKSVTNELPNLKLGGKDIILRNADNLDNFVKQKKDSKFDLNILNQINAKNNNNKGNNIFMSEESKKTISKLKNGDLLNIKEIIPRNKVIFDIKNKDSINEENNSSNDTKNNNNLNINKSNNLIEKTKNFNLTKLKSPKAKYFINSVDNGQNTIFNNKKIFSENFKLFNSIEQNKGNENNVNNENIFKNINILKNKNIAIKLIKNKLQKNKNINLDYLKQQSKTLNLYKEFYDKKIKEQKEKNKIKEKINIPKKVSPAFGRTAYVDFNKGIRNIKLDNYNGNMNININNIQNKCVNEFNDFNTINGTLNHLYFSQKKQKTKNKIDDNFNLSI